MRYDELQFSCILEADGDSAPLSKAVGPDDFSFTVFFMFHQGSDLVRILSFIEEISKGIFI